MNISVTDDVDVHDCEDEYGKSKSLGENNSLNLHK